MKNFAQLSIPLFEEKTEKQLISIEMKILNRMPASKIKKMFGGIEKNLKRKTL